MNGNELLENKDYRIGKRKSLEGEDQIVAIISYIGKWKELMLALVDIQIVAVNGDLKNPSHLHLFLPGRLNWVNFLPGYSNICLPGT